MMNLDSTMKKIIEASYLTSSELAEVVIAINTKKMADYQEGLINELVEDIRREY